MPTLEKRTPFRELDRMERRVRRMFEDAGFLPALVPVADVWETDLEYVLELEVPGYDEADLDVEVLDRTLVVKGERMEEIEPERAYLVRERLERHFQRRFDLPIEADVEHVTADYGKGLLTLHVPKTGVTEPKRIPITTV